MEQGQVFGLNILELLAEYDQGTQLLKMCQGLLFQEDSESSFRDLPKSGIMLNGKIFRQQKWEHGIKEKESGLLPTIKAQEPGSTSHGYGDSLREAICKKEGIPTKKYPTPTVNGNYNKKGASKKSGDGLETFVKKYPTPTARDCMSRGQGEGKRNFPALNHVATNGQGGNLNPLFVEWLMGYPEKWTELKD